MEMEKKNLSCLLNNYSFIVPEIQREYVWGAKKNNHVLIQFLNDLNEKLAKGDANIGFLYSYRSGSEHYLIDGQQRYTTMILLLHFLSKREGNCDFVNLMKLNNKIPAFSYRVRTYTESFLTHLLKSNATNEKEVKNQKWFKKEYLTDTTIVSMLGALDAFSENIKYLENLTISNVMEKVHFWYFDVEQTSQGEELYITMNSRGEKLTDSEQIKPRLLNNVKDEMTKHRFGKEWDNWEEFFYKENLRGTRKVELINEAMNNVVRIVLELKTSREHDRIKPVEDAELVSIEDVKTYMDAIMFFEQYESGFYLHEIERLYGDSKVDGNFYVLKGLLTEKIKGQTDAQEYLRVYQTILNQVRRNKIQNIDYLTFLENYRVSHLSFYDFIINADETENKKVVNGHELEKVTLCSQLGETFENVIWEEQANPFWNGDIKQLISWAKVDGVFDLNKFNRIRKVFNVLFDRKASDGWTSDDIRHALLTKHMPKYPLVKGNYTYFGYSNVEWKEIFAAQSNDVLKFIEDLENKNIHNEILSLIKSYPETVENKWAEFVNHDYLLQYCDTKHLYWDENYGHQLVKSVYAKPISVRNMLIYQYLQSNWNCICCNREYTLNIWINWNSCVYIENKASNKVLDIRFLRNNNNPRYLLYYFKRNQPEETEIQLKDIADELGFIFSGERYTLEITENKTEQLQEIIRKITTS